MQKSPQQGPPTRLGLPPPWRRGCSPGLGVGRGDGCVTWVTALPQRVQKVLLPVDPLISKASHGGGHVPGLSKRKPSHIT